MQDQLSEAVPVRKAWFLWVQGPEATEECPAIPGEAAALQK